MSTPDPEGFSLLAKVVAAGSAILAPVGWLYSKLDKKADKAEFKEYVKETLEVRKEIRESLRDLYRNAETDRKIMREGFDEIRENMHQMHVTLLDKIQK